MRSVAKAFGQGRRPTRWRFRISQDRMASAGANVPTLTFGLLGRVADPACSANDEADHVSTLNERGGMAADQHGAELRPSAAQRWDFLAGYKDTFFRNFGSLAETTPTTHSLSSAVPKRARQFNERSGLSYVQAALRGGRDAGAGQRLPPRA